MTAGLERGASPEFRELESLSTEAWLQVASLWQPLYRGEQDLY